MRATILAMILAFVPYFAEAGGDVRSKFLQVGDDNFHYLSMGDESKPVLLFIHGFPEFSLTWREQLKHFSDRFHAVAVDLRGYNLSSKPKDLEAYKSQSVAEGIYQFARKLSPDRPIYVVAHDWGGSIAWLLTATHKDLVKGLVIINVGHPVLYFREYTKGPSPAGGSKPSQYDMSIYIRNIRAGIWNEEYYTKNNFEVFGSVLFDNAIGSSKTFFDDLTKAAYLKAWSEVDPQTSVSALTASLNYYRAMEIPEPGFWTEKLIWLAQKRGKYRVDVPTLILWGTTDHFVSEDVNGGLSDVVSDATLKRFDGYSHWIVHENPKLVNREIDGFLEQRFGEKPRY